MNSVDTLFDIARQRLDPFRQQFKQENIEQLPIFPVGALPLSVADFIRAAAENIQASADLVGPCVLGALETACRGRYPVKLPNGHTERPCLYIAPVAPPSERKSSVIEVVMKPLIDYEIRYNTAHSGEVEQSQSDRRILEARKEALEREAAKAKTEESREKARRELEEINEEIAAFNPIKPLRLCGCHVGPEKLADLLYAQNETFALVSAEGGGLFDNIGRYVEKGGMDIYLNGYSGDVVYVDRKSSTSVSLKCPTLNIIALCQPIVIETLFGDKEKAGRGLLSRILFVKCQSLVGRRKPVSCPIEPATKKGYDYLCRSMLAAENGGELTFDDGGYAVYCRFFEEVEPLLTPDSGELSLMGDWAGKVCGTMTRLAGLIHCIVSFERDENPTTTPITAEEAESGVTLARFFLAHAKAVYVEQIEPQSEKDARYLSQIKLEKQPSNFRAKFGMKIFAKYLLKRLKEKSPVSRSEITRKVHHYRMGHFSLPKLQAR